MRVHNQEIPADHAEDMKCIRQFMSILALWRLVVQASFHETIHGKIYQFYLVDSNPLTNFFDLDSNMLIALSEIPHLRHFRFDLERKTLSLHLLHDSERNQ